MVLAGLAYALPALWACPGVGAPPLPAAIPPTLAAYLGFGVIVLLVALRSSAMKRLSQLSVGVDLIVVTVLVALSGGTDSQLVLLYMLVIVGVSVLLSPINGMTAAIASVSMLSLIYLAQSVGWATRCAPLGAGQGSVFRFVAVVSFLVLTAFLAGYLALAGSRLKLLNLEILESMNAGVAIVDLDGNVQYLNVMGLRLLGLEASSVRGEPVDRVLAGQAAEAIMATLRTGVPVSRREVSIASNHGGAIPSGITTSVLGDRRRRIWGVAATFTDLTDVRRMEERLRHADRMATISHSAAGMSHELRNPLACIRGGVDLLSEILPKDEEASEVMDLIARETQRLSTIVESFLDVSRIDSPVCEVHSFGEIWREVETVLRARFGQVLDNKVRLTLAQGSEEVALWADLGQMRQVLINLVQNAIEALADGGGIQVSCQYARAVAKEGLGPGTEIIVRDDGPGVPLGVGHRIFEPFYTSKARGTGLGLAVVKRIVEGHSGDVRLLADQERGSAFRIWLPLRNGAVTTT